MKIVVITSDDDAHLPFVQDHLAGDTEVIVVDPFSHLGKKDISYEFKDQELCVLHGQKSLEGVSSVWYRKPNPLVVSELKVPEAYRQYIEDGLNHHMTAIRRHWKDALWVSKYDAIAQAQAKPHQMVRAAA